MVKKFSLLITLLAGWILLAGTLIPAPMAQAQVNTGSLRIVNGLLGVGPVDVFVDDERVAFGLQPQAVTPYVSLAAGRHALAIRAVGADRLAAPLADILIDLSPNGSQTAVVYQRQTNTAEAFGGALAQSGAIFIVDDDRSPTQLGQTRLTAVNLALNAPERINIGYPSGEALLYQVVREQPFGTIDIDAGAYSLAVLDGESAARQILARLGEQVFYSNTLYTLIVVPNPTVVAGSATAGAEPVIAFSLSAPLDTETEAGIRLRIIHAAHSTAVLDLYIDERLVASRVNYSRFTEYLGLASYSHIITIRRAGDAPTAAPLGRAELTITEENRQQSNWTLLLLNGSESNAEALNAATTQNQPNAPVLVNTPGGTILMALLPDNLSETQRGFARVRVVNAADGVPPLALLTDALPPSEVLPGTPTPVPTATPIPGARPTLIPLTDAVSFGVEANEQDVPAGLYGQLLFVPIGSSNPLTTLNDVQLVNGIVYTLYVIGSPIGDPPIQVLTFQDFGFGLSTERTYTGTIVVDNANKCRIYKADTLDVEVKVLPPANHAPVLSVFNQN
ncbi:MAG: DUF4397 domain-containing protein, partial [Anaerolineae bacterium]|nr:DUF4397 domain-containing protein [Anaerolineae bacterium]